MPVIRFEPSDATVVCASGESLFDAGRRIGIPIPTACVAQASCGLCRVQVLAGEGHLSPMTPDEKRHLGNAYFISKIRLACQTRVAGGDVTVRVLGT